MDKEQEREWAKAQSISLSVDLVSAAKTHLNFLAVIDRNRYLYEGPTLERAIYRYNAFWLPLLAKHLENPVTDDPLVVPLDCEWIWHCHRLNPVRYKLDCEKLFGRILGKHNIISSVEGTSKSKSEEVWRAMYPEEPYELDYSRLHDIEDVSLSNLQSEKFTSYDLVSAVKRQVPFGYQVSMPHVSQDLFLQEALARYKGFLHLIRTNWTKNIKNSFVPTYDVDLMWHSHQLHPVSYSDDLYKLLGKVMGHDDTKSDRTKGEKLDTGFSRTTKLWEDTFGSRYWKAGATYRGPTPTPVTQIPFPFTYEGGKKFHHIDSSENLIQFLETKTVKVLLEFVEVKNLPEGHKGDDVRVSFSKKKPDKSFNDKRTLTILSESKQKQIAHIQCEPSEEFLFELVCHSSSNKQLPTSFKTFGSCTLSLQECLASGSQLSIDKWLTVVPTSGTVTSNPILLHVSLSFTPPTPALKVFQLIWSELSSLWKVKHVNGRICATNNDANDVLRFQMRDLSNDTTRSIPELLKEVQCTTASGETHTLAEFKGNEWSIKEAGYSLRLIKTSGNDGHLFELIGRRMVRLYAGRKLDYEPKQSGNKRNEQDFMTAVEFSTEYPYGEAIAMVDFKHGILKVKDERMILIGITSTIILYDILKRKGNFATNMQNHITCRNIKNAKQGISEGGVYSGAECAGGCGSTDCAATGYEAECSTCSTTGCEAECSATGCEVEFGGECTAECSMIDCEAEGVEYVDTSYSGKCDDHVARNCGLVANSHGFGVVWCECGLE